MRSLVLALLALSLSAALPLSAQTGAQNKTGAQPTTAGVSSGSAAGGPVDWITLSRSEEAVDANRSQGLNQQRNIVYFNTVERASATGSLKYSIPTSVLTITVPGTYTFDYNVEALGTDNSRISYGLLHNGTPLQSLPVRASEAIGGPGISGHYIFHVPTSPYYIQLGLPQTVSYPKFTGFGQGYLIVTRLD